MNPLDAVYDITPIGVVWIGVALAAAACGVPFLVAVAAPDWATATCAILVAAWLIFIVLALIAHRRQVLWIVATAPLAMVWPLTYLVAFWACTSRGACL